MHPRSERAPLMKNERREWLKFAGSALIAGAGLNNAPGFAQAPKFRDADRTKDKIVALVRASGDRDPSRIRYVQKIEPLLIRIPEVKARPDELPLMDYFVGDLLLRYSFDDPKYVSSVNLGDLKLLKLKREELLDLSTANFRRLYPNLKLEHPVSGVASVTNAGELEPCLMLDTRYWEGESRRLKGEIVVAVPARDALLFADLRNIEALRRIAADLYEVAKDNALSQWLYQWKHGYWEVHT